MGFNPALGDGTAAPKERLTCGLNCCFCVSMSRTLKSRPQEGQPFGNAPLSYNVLGCLGAYPGHRMPSPTGWRTLPQHLGGPPHATQRVASRVDRPVCSMSLGAGIFRAPRLAAKFLEAIPLRSGIPLVLSQRKKMRARITATGENGGPPFPGLLDCVTDCGSVGRLGRMPVAVAALFLAALGSCDSDPVIEPEPTLEIVPDSVTLTHIGHQFAFTVRGGEAVRWNSRDLAVFTVDADGMVTARGNGTAQVQAWTPESSDHALVRVRQSADMLEAFGDGQRAAAGLWLIEPVGVRVLDAGGAPVSGFTVRFEPGAGDGKVEPVEAQTDSAGVASARWTLGPEPGPQTLAVSAEGLAVVEIAATALLPDEAVDSFEVHAGRDQWAWSGRVLAAPIVVRALDEGGRPMRAATVRFEPDAGGRAAPETAISDSSGVSSTTWTLGAVAGPQTLAVSTGGDARVEVIATARDPDGAVASVEVHSGEDQWGLAGQALPDSVAVIVTDDTGRPVWGAAVRFEPEAASGSADPGTARTDSLGLASAEWTLGSELGAQRLVVTAGGVAVSFEAAAVSDEGVCNRTPEVSAAIVQRLTQFHRTRVSGCAEVTDEALGRIDLLQLHRKGIKRLRSGDFAGLVALGVLHLQENELAELPAGVFDGLSQLRRLGLQYNQLVELPHDLLAQLGQLQSLDLDGNRLPELPPDIFEGLARLRYLYLGANELTQLRPDIFDGLSALENLHLSHNRLTSLPEDVFDGLSNLEFLTMRGNQLTSLPEDIFSGLSRLTDLRVGNNRLTGLAAGVFRETSNLQRLNLEGNRLTELPPGLLSETPALQQLFLRINRLTMLPPDVFEGLPNLFRLALRNNDLTELPPGIFARTPKLAELSLEFNRIEQLAPGLFAGLSELEWVTLHGNTGSPFPIRPEFVRVDGDPLAPGPARVAVQLSPGAPFAFSVPVSVQRGTISREAVSLLAGDTISAVFEVSASVDGDAAHVGFEPLAAFVPEGYEGLALARGEELVLFAEADNRSPVARSVIPAHRLQAGGPSADLVLADYFDDPDGDLLAYTVAMTESGVVAERIEDGVLWLDPMSVDTTEVEVTATDPGGLRATHRFRAWVVPAPDPDAFNIELYFDPGFTPEEEAVIRRAANRWTEVVTGDLPDVPVLGPLSKSCFDGPSPPRVVGVIDDVLVRMTFVARVGVGRNVGAAATCGERESGQAFLGASWFAQWYFRDRDGGMEDLYETALHEIGHILGLGLWAYSTSPESWRELFRDGDGDGHFAGPRAVAAFDAAGGEAYVGGKVPLEDRISSTNIHWRKRVIPGDIMAPGGGSLLTAISIQALADLGYEVDVSKADPYTLPMAAQGDALGDIAVEGGDAEVLVDDVIMVPVVVVDRNGKVVRIIRR